MPGEQEKDVKIVYAEAPKKELPKWVMSFIVPLAFSLAAFVGSWATVQASVSQNSKGIEKLEEKVDKNSSNVHLIELNTVKFMAQMNVSMQNVEENIKEINQKLDKAR